jgi:hypothetical protein
VIVPPLWVEELTTELVAALNPALVVGVLLLLLPPPHAARARVTTALKAASPMILRLFMR